MLFDLLKSRFYLYRCIGQLKLRLKAIRSNKVFACKALHGESGYNICINSDLTVSCNCQDYDGSGHIGDLKVEGFEEIIFGEKSQRFREALASCRFPVNVCWVCSDFILVNESEKHKYLNEPKLPKGIMVENTVLCNLSCVGCNRNKLMNIRSHKKLPSGGIEIISDIVSTYQIKNISFFNLGEPFISDKCADEIKTLKMKNKDARVITSTNGVYLDSLEKMDAALLLDHIYFSIDGSNQDTLTKYQIGGDFEKTYNNMKAIVELRNKRGATVPVIEWKYVLFRWNDHPLHIKKAIALARQAKVDIISFWPGGATLTYRSFRYHLHPFYKKLGKKSWKGREIDFRTETV
jgi:radical SAM family protein/4Fe-4S single cluster protein